jgi:CubicO group peptidase (beta-lactamase class C family)
MADQLHYGDPEEVGMSGERIRKAARVAEHWVDAGHTSGLVVLVARRGRIVLHEAFGRLTPEPAAPPPPLDAIFPLASITKPIVATAVMCLVEDGLIGLNRPVQEYVPEFVGEGKEQVMVHHLLTHTSGLREVDANAHAERKRLTATVPPPATNQHPAIAERLYLTYDTPLWKPPGQEMSYCSFTFYLLGEIVRRVSGQALERFASERIFGPLGMRDTTFTVPAALQPRFARRYVQDPSPPATAYAASLETPDRLVTPWGANSTASDLAIFGQMFLQQGSYGDARVLSPASVAAMTRNQIPGIAVSFDDERFPEASWGLGWEIQGGRRGQREPSLVSPHTFAHAGLGGTYLWVNPDSEIVGVYLALLRKGTPWMRPAWNGDLVINAIMAAIDV